MQGTLMTSLPPLVTGTEVAETDTSFITWCRYLHSGPSYCSYTHDLTYITVSVLLLLLLLDFSCVGGACRGLLLLIPPFKMPFPFLFLAGLLWRLVCLRRPGRGRFYFFYLKLLLVGVFRGCPLGLHLWGGTVGRVVTSRTSDIRISDHGAGS